MKKTNNSLRVLALVICLVMALGTFTSCFSGTDINTGSSEVNTGTSSSTQTTNGGTTTGDSAENDPIEDPVDPNQIFAASAQLAENALIYGALANSVVIGDTDSINAIVPADVKIEFGASSLDLSIKNVDELDVTLSEYESAKNLDVHVSGIAQNNTVPMIVNLGAVLEAGLSETELKLYHIENGSPVLMMRVNSALDFAIHNQYTYNSETGEVTIYVSTFSVFSAVKTTASKWEDDTEADTSWYNENDTEFTLEDVADFLGFRDLVDAGNNFEGKTVKLATDIDLNKKLFNPIGGGWAYNDGNTFNGTFDGQNHTIYNIYVNGWELDETGDKHSGTSKGAGLFSSIHNATIKNLTISGAEMIVETTSIGVVVGCAQGKCTFDNIIVSNATLGNYQMRNGGIVGDIYVIASDNVPENEYSHTFTNIVVDSTVKLSSMWGDFDTGNGGVIGGKYGSSKVLMKNVIVAAELDVFSDVTAAYQWYAYRRCGMLVGYTGQNSPKQATNAAADFLTCENVSVYYGNWTNYTYYQFANQTDEQGNRLWNSNYPWVRAQESPYNGPFSNVRYGNPIINGEKINTLELAEAHYTDKVTITFDQLYGGGQGVYGTNEHEGVTINNDLTSSKTIFILNNQNWENLKLQYWFRNGEDTWTTNIDGIDMSGMYLSSYNVYKVELPAYVDGFRIVADGENEVEFTLADLDDGETYTVGGETHDHEFDSDGKCSCGAQKNKQWELVTDVSTLSNGDQIIIVSSNSNVALGTTQNTNNRNQVGIVKNDDNTVTINLNVQVITLEEGGIEGTFAFNVGNGYLYAASSSSNHLKTDTKITDNGCWKIEIADGVATIKAQGTYTNNWLRYNSSSSLFSCYGSGQNNVSIYKLSATGDDIVEVHDCKEYADGATCTGNAICLQCSQEIADSALGHDYVGKETAPTCIDAGYITNTCSRCKDTLRVEGAAALGHTYVGGICSVCGAIDSSAIDYSGLYYIATIRTSGNYFYITNSLGTASTKRYQAVDSGLTTLPSSINDAESNKIFVFEKNENGTYSIYAEGVEGEKYLGWTSDNSGMLVAKENALELTIDKKDDGTFNIHFTGDVERYLALNQNTGSNYFAWYKSGQKQNLTLIPVIVCDHENTSTTTVDATCTAAGSTTVTCNDCGTIISSTEITVLKHTDVTTDNDHNCDVCDAENVTEHNYVDGTCDCGATKPTDQPETPTEPTWTKTDLADIEATDIVVITWTKGTTTWALSSSNGSSKAPTAVVITISENNLTGDIADAIKWNISNNNGNLTIYPNGTTTTWLYCTNANDGVRVGTNANKVFTIDATSGYLKNTATNRYVGVYTTNPDIRCYTNTTGNTEGQTLAFYVLSNGTSGGNNGGSEGGETPAPEHICESICGECGKCTNAECTEDVCVNNQCEGHTTEPELTEKNYSYTFSSKQYSANGTKTLNGVDWTLAGNGGYWGSDGTKGQQFGSSSSPYKSMTLTSESFSNVSKIVINTSGASSVNATFTVTVNGVQVGSSTKITSSATEYTFELDEAITGEIVITYTQTSSKALYIKSISVKYAE